LGPCGTAFNGWLRHLEGYVARTGSAYVPVTHSENGENLGEWVRGLQNGRRISDVQRALLETVPGWNWDRRAYVLSAHTATNETKLF
jgi:hypothetical protein